MEIASLENEFADVPFHPIWINIARFMKGEVLDRLCLHVPELRGIDRLVKAERESMACKKEIMYWRERPNEKGEPLPSCSVDIGEKELWYSWYANDADFGSVNNFRTFCHMAGIEPEVVKSWSPHRTTFYRISEDAKVAFQSHSNLLGNNHYTSWIEVTGIRCRSKCLLDWFLRNCECDYWF